MSNIGVESIHNKHRKPMKTSLLLRFLTNMLILFTSFRAVSQGQDQATGITREVFGTMPDGREVHLFTLRNGTGMAVQVTNYGGYLVSWTAPNRRGHFENITLGLPAFADYLKGTPALGPVIGRYANRIAGGTFTLDGKPYQLTTNGSGNHIHGGKAGFDKKLWTATPRDGQEPALKLACTSPDGEEGYPGTLAVEVTYTLQRDNALRIDYRATTDQPTIVNLTNHAYFNLDGMGRDILGHVLTIPADRFLPTDKAQLPTGQRQPVTGTPFDFTKPTPIGARIDDTTHAQIRYGFGYDHCWVLTDAPGPVARRGGRVRTRKRPAARSVHHRAGVAALHRQPPQRQAARPGRRGLHPPLRAVPRNPALPRFPQPPRLPDHDPPPRPDVPFHDGVQGVGEVSG
jgi:aldose 1-epimerase